MSEFRTLVQDRIKSKLAGSQEESLMDRIKVSILGAIDEDRVYVRVPFDGLLDSDSLSKLRALCYLEFGFDVPDIGVDGIFIDFRHFL